MGEKYSFFNAKLDNDTYDRTYKAEDLAEYFASFIANGVFPNPSTNLQITANGDMTISIAEGKGWINGYYYNNTEALTKTLTTADGTLNRIDLVVLRLDLANRLMQVDIITGTTASTPVAPELTRTDTVYELGLASIYVTAGTTAISQANITDLRYNQDYCGYVTDVVNTIDTSTLLAQVEAWMTQKETECENAFTTWFENVKAVLADDVAGNLELLIEANAQNISNIQKSISDIEIIRKNLNTIVNGNIEKTYITNMIENSKYIERYEDKHNWFLVRNGWCEVHLDLNIKTDNLNSYGICRGLPASVDDEEIWAVLKGQGGNMKNKSVGVLLIGGAIKLDYSGGAGRYMGSFSYPVKL